MKKIRKLFTEDGVALPLVLALMIIMTLLSITAMNIAANNTTLASRFFGTEKALYAAEKGYNQYLWKLNNDGDFYLDTNKYTCDTATAGFYIYTPKDDEGENYRVQIRIPVISGTPVSNQAFIRSTGWNSNDPEQQRTVEVELLRRSFTQYAMVSNTENASDGDKVIWYQDDEVFGPIHTNDTFYLYNELLNGSNATFWSEVTYRNGIKVIDADSFLEIIDNASVLNDPNIFKKGHMQLDREIQFPGNAELNELRVLARTNGDYYNGRTCIFLKGTSYDVRYYDRDTSSWYYNGQRYRISLYKNNLPPSTITECKKTLSEWENESSSERYLYQALDNNNNVIGEYNSFAAFESSGLCPSISLPENRVIFVDGMTGDGSHPFNSTLAAKYQPTMGNVFVSGKLADRLTIVSANDIYITGHDPTDWRHPRKISGFNGSSPPGITYSSPVPYYRNQFADDQFTETTVYGTNEMLGLIASRNVHVLRWNWPSQISHTVNASLLLPEGDRFSYNWGKGIPTITEYLALTSLDYSNLIAYDTAPENISIYGALFAINGSFGLETNYVGLSTLKQTLGGLFLSLSDVTSEKEQMTIFGSIGQHFREHSTKPPTFGVLGLGDWVDGYSTSFTHDPRMINDMPPYFVSPPKSGWYSIHWEETSNHIPSS